MTEFGKAIRILRIENNRKQKQDAEDFGTTASYISAIECGKKKVTNSYLEYCINTYGNKDRLTELAEKHNKSTEKIAVIRCRDCKHWLTVFDKEIAESGLCNKYSQLETTKADDYCSRSERRNK